MAEFPLNQSAPRVNRAQGSPVRFRFVGRKIGTAVIGMTCFVGLRRSAEDVALLSCTHIEEAGLYVEAWGHPVCGTQGARTYRPSRPSRRTLLVRNGAALAVLTIAPCNSAVRVGRKQLA